jgi:hypothetical protein
VGLYINSPTRLRGVVLNELNTGTALPYLLPSGHRQIMHLYIHLFIFPAISPYIGQCITHRRGCIVLLSNYPLRVSCEHTILSLNTTFKKKLCEI